MSKYHNPVKIVKSSFWLEELNNQMKSLGISQPFFVTSSGNRSRLNLDSHFNNEHIFELDNSNPTFENCEEIFSHLEKIKVNGVIAIGGGSVMDLAKVSISFLSCQSKSLLGLINNEYDYKNSIPSVFIPTTHGTASEVTQWGTIWDMNEKRKHSISHHKLYPDVAILDGNLCLSLPIDISIATTLDAISHSFEAIWNKNGNPKSDEYAINAISKIFNNIDLFKTDTKNSKIRNKILEASTIAGLAFSNTKTAAAHSISYPLTIHFGIPHGIASSITLSSLLDINKNLISEQLLEISQKTGLSFEEIKNKIESIPDKILPFNLAGWGIKKNDLSLILKESFTKGRMDNNIVDLNLEDVDNILKYSLSKD